MSKRAKAYPLLAALSALVVAGCQTSPTAPRGSTGTSNQAVDEAVGVQQLRREVAELRNMVEVQSNEMERLRERQRQLYDDLDYRLRQGEQGGSAAPRQQSTSPSRAESGGQAAGQQDQDAAAPGRDQEIYGQQGVAQQEQPADRQDGGQSGEGVQQEQTAAIQQSPDPSRQESQQNAVASADEQAAYDSAFELLKQSRYNDAIIEFRSMISEFPNGALVDDAQYWIGEAYYVTRDFENALDAFQAVVNRYSDSQRVPEALLKLGYVQAELGQTEDARRTLNQVISQYPGSRVAISAETRLSKIR